MKSTIERVPYNVIGYLPNPMLALKELIAPSSRRKIDGIIDIPSLAARVSAPFDNHELLYAFANLAIKLKPTLSTYDTILGDDASARIPALLLTRLAGQKRAEEGKDKPKLYFIHPILGLSSSYAKFEAFLETHAEIQRVLFVSEYLQSGVHAGMIAEFLRDHQKSWNIASISILSPPDCYSFQDHLFYGSLGKAGEDAFHDAYDLAGVKTEGDTITGYVLEEYPPGISLKKIKQQARQDAATVADALWPLVAGRSD